ncbi:uncharacterized protein N7484_006421 [Penicillium longicatenatum]|uniref:uncharacterized protein n=1 Tax=Penicillium longicatenatum TaxID=1561947 RepID=UPI0025483F50|nr:uncharacterized protein N7484_006421 [Penicillium longicatenatum]KAJ5643914.1 hypothetical protein N7484_006421 [Penicillium longicatenatum]
MILVRAPLQAVLLVIEFLALMAQAAVINRDVSDIHANRGRVNLRGLDHFPILANKLVARALSTDYVTSTSTEISCAPDVPGCPRTSWTSAVPTASSISSAPASTPLILTESSTSSDPAVTSETPMSRTPLVTPGISPSESNTPGQTAQVSTSTDTVVEPCPSGSKTGMSPVPTVPVVTISIECSHTTGCHPPAPSVPSVPGAPGLGPGAPPAPSVPAVPGAPPAGAPPSPSVPGAPTKSIPDVPGIPTGNYPPAGNNPPVGNNPSSGNNPPAGNNPSAGGHPTPSGSLPGNPTPTKAFSKAAKVPSKIVNIVVTGFVTLLFISTL